MLLLPGIRQTGTELRLGFCAVLSVVSAPCPLICFTSVLPVTGVVNGVGQGQASFLLVHAEWGSDPSASALKLIY